MASSAHFLRLPQELRDQIYSYLWGETSFKWLFRYGHQSGSATIDIEVHNIPPMNLLLTCSKICKDYSESKSIYPLSIIAHWGTPKHVSLNNSRRVPVAVEEHGSFAQSWRATLIVGLAYKSDNRERWEILVKALCSKSPMLVSFRIAMLTNIHKTDPFGNILVLPTSSAVLDHLPTPPSALVVAEMPLIQACACVVTRSSHSASIYDPAYHINCMVGVYTYGSVFSRHQWWNKAGVLQYLPPGIHSKPGPFSSDCRERAILAHLPFLFERWTEERGSEIKTWNGFELKESSLIKAGNQGFALWLE